MTAAGSSSPPSAAFFDLDRTLMSGTSAYYFAKAAYREGLLPLPRLAVDTANALAFKLFGASDEKSEALRDRLLASVAGTDADTLRRLAPSVVEEVLPRIRPEAEALIEMHQQGGRAVYIISASPVEVVAELAQALGITGGVGTESEMVDGIYTGRLAGPFCYGQGKADRLRKLAADQGYDLSRSYAYSDSASDLPMMQLVGHPVAVNPDRSLMSVAHSRGWPIVEFNRQTKQALKLGATSTGVVGAAVFGYLAGRRQGVRLATPSTQRMVDRLRATLAGPR